ncbi:unnamed protein product [Meloidogyne enterolobii]|uniref:Uncharacterized protein n=1 Tax=Meloidogyne enterolobii TaxID=390850 RepID=A0ACB0Y6X0_MELEN
MIGSKIDWASWGVEMNPKERKLQKIWKDWILKVLLLMKIIRNCQERKSCFRMMEVEEEERLEEVEKRLLDLMKMRRMMVGIKLRMKEMRRKRKMEKMRRISWNI